MLEALGRATEAIALVRAQADGGNRVARPVLAGLLARNGRVDEAIESLRPDVDDAFLLRALVETTEGHGRDAEVAALIRPLVENETRCWKREPLIQLSRVLERQGRADEAVALLRPRAADAPNTAAGSLVHVLARNGRAEEAIEAALPLLEDRESDWLLASLTQMFADQGRAEAALGLVDHKIRNADTQERETLIPYRVWLLEEMGRLEEALAQARAIVDDVYSLRARNVASVLEKAGRPDEAITVLRGSTDRTDRLDLAHLLIRQGRPDEAVELFRPTGTPGDEPPHKDS
ncbi:tetratricopeptide repeat protein [Streptomyces sp. NPDC058751]|uniref:tetratricopeptide repeat protein n=1 Tax=Streptomyces sp. NPDC058751 TaxID=3346623 RepID=UPI0036AE87CC